MSKSRNVKKMVLVLLIICLIAFGCAPLLSSCGDRTLKLKVYNWADYIADGVLEEFEAYYKEITGKDIKVNYTTFDTNETMLSKVAAGADYDVICPSDYAIEKLAKANRLTPLVKDLGVNFADNTPIEDYRDMQSQFIFDRTEYDPGNVYSRAFTFGTMGILYNKALLAPEHQADTDNSGHPDWMEEVGWGALWGKNTNGSTNNFYKRKNNGILMKDSLRDTFAVGALYTFRNELLAGTRTAGEVLNTSNKSDLDKIERSLKDQKPLIKGYEVDYGKQEAVDGKVAMTLQWGGDAVWAIADAADKGVELEYFVPNEGTNLFFDGWCIPTTSGNPDAAQLFVNFICRPDIAIKNMDYIGYSTPCNTQEFVDYMEECFSGDDEEDEDEKMEPRLLEYFMGDDTLIYAPYTMYPHEEVVTKAGVMRDFGKTEDLIIDLWIRVKVS